MKPEGLAQRIEQLEAALDQIIEIADREEDIESSMEPDMTGIAANDAMDRIITIATAARKNIPEGWV